MDINLALQNQLTERQRRKDAKSNVERIWSPKQIQNAFLETFEMVGGVPRLAVWANNEENYEAFLKMLITLAPKGAAALLAGQQGQIIEYRSNVPRSPLNRQQEAEDGDLVSDSIGGGSISGERCSRGGDCDGGPEILPHLSTISYDGAGAEFDE